MKVYHASTVIVERPDTLHSRSYLDFGRGFYVTVLIEQARKYGDRFSRRGKVAVLNTYELADDLGQWRVYNQICIRSQKVLNQCLIFKSSELL